MKRAMLLLLALSLLLAGCGREMTEEVPELLEPVGVKSDREAAYIGTISRIEIYKGAVMPEVAALYFELDGVIESVNVVPGQQVKKGDVLLELDQTEWLENHERLQEDYDYTVIMNDYANRLSQLDIDRMQAVLRQQESLGADVQTLRSLQLDIEEQELLLAQQKERQALELSAKQIDLESAASMLNRNQIIAPFDGEVVFGEKLNRGDRVSAYANLIFVADSTRMHVESEYVLDASIQKSHRVYAKIGAHELDLTPRPFEKEAYMATVLSGGTPVTLYDLPEELPEDVETGMYAAVCLECDYKENALLVPSNALFSDTYGRYVYVFGDEGEDRVRREVTVGISNRWLTEITEGLEEGEMVYVAG